MTPDTMAFLRDVLRHCAVLFHRVKLKHEGETKELDKRDSRISFSEGRFSLLLYKNGPALSHNGCEMGPFWMAG